MKKTILALLVSAAAISGYAKDCCAAKNSPVGNWGMKLPYSSMNAGHMIISSGADGKHSALVLWRWASPSKAQSCKVTGSLFRVKLSNGLVLKGKVSGDKFSAKAYNKKGVLEGEVSGWRNPPADGSVSVKDAKFGESVDLLADGLDGWETMNPSGKFGWSFKDGVLSNSLGLKPDGTWAGGGANLRTKRGDFKDFRLEYDVRVPKNSNSGVYLRGRYEIQVVDSYGKKPDCHAMAALYGRITPSVAAEKPAGEWQHVSVIFYKHRLTVVLNGKTIIDDKPVEGVTGGAMDADENASGPIYLQGDHSDADFKNIKLYPAVD